MNFKNIFLNKRSSYLFTFLVCGFIMLGISSCKEDIPGVGGIEDLTPPSAVFSYTASDDDYKEISFINTSISSTDYSWNFGDGNTSSEIEPTHVYAEDGTYEVTLTASDKNNVESTATETIVIMAAPLPLSADFSFAVSDTDFSSVTFTNLSVSADTYAWDFGDGTGTSTDENPQYMYPAISGSYIVTLVASSSVTGESETTTRTVGIVDPDADLIANFSFELDDFEVTFTNLSSGAVSYSWDFGDGSSTSTDENPVYTYALPGAFEVVLTATDAVGGMVTATQTVTITVPDPTFTPVILDPGFEPVPPATDDDSGKESWRDPGEELGGVIQITSSPVFNGVKSAKLPSDNTRVGYQMITVEAYQDYILSFYYTMKESPTGSLKVAVLAGEVNDPAEVDAASLGSITLTDQTDQDVYIYESFQFNSGDNTEVVIYFKNVDVECRLDDFDIQNN